MKCELLTWDFQPERDCFKGIPTILTCEEAALVTCEKLFNEIPDGEMFLDKDFGPKDDDDEEGRSAKCMYALKYCNT